MPGFAPNFTGRYRIVYRAGGAIHSQTWRYPGPETGSGVSDIDNAVVSFWEAAIPIRFADFAVNAVSVAAPNSEIFLPHANGFTSGGDVALPTGDTEFKADAATFVGRTAGGNPWKVTAYGLDKTAIQVAGQKNYRVLSGENADIDAMLTVLFSATSATIGNDGLPITWYNYVNLKPNDRWVKKARRGA